jgi:hypothetical protein
VEALPLNRQRVYQRGVNASLINGRAVGGDPDSVGFRRKTQARRWPAIDGPSACRDDGLVLNASRTAKMTLEAFGTWDGSTTGDLDDSRQAIKPSSPRRPLSRTPKRCL